MTQEQKSQETIEPKPTRIFVYDGREFEDPDPKMTIDEVRLYYANFFPELGTAEVLPVVKRTKEAPEGGKVEEEVTEFRRKTGVKGGNTKKLYVAVEVFGLLVTDVHGFWNEQQAHDWFKGYTGVDYAEDVELPDDYDQTKIFLIEV